MAEHKEGQLDDDENSTTGVFMVQDNKTINKSNVSMRLFSSTGEPDGRGSRIWDGGLTVSLTIW